MTFLIFVIINILILKNEKTKSTFISIAHQNGDEAIVKLLIEYEDNNKVH